MTDTAEQKFYDHLAPTRNEHAIVDRKPTRLEQSLAANVVVAALGTGVERVYTKGAAKLRVRVKVTGTALNATLTLHPLLADESTRAVTGDGSVVLVTTAVEYMLDLDLKGEKYVELQVNNLHAANSLTVNYVDVYLF